jgi:hypothetical protein
MVADIGAARAFIIATWRSQRRQRYVEGAVPCRCVLDSIAADGERGLGRDQDDGATMRRADPPSPRWCPALSMGCPAGPKAVSQQKQRVRRCPACPLAERHIGPVAASVAGRRVPRLPSPISTPSLKNRLDSRDSTAPGPPNAHRSGRSRRPSVCARSPGQGRDRRDRADLWLTGRCTDRAPNAKGRTPWWATSP